METKDIKFICSPNIFCFNMLMYFFNYNIQHDFDLFGVLGRGFLFLLSVENSCPPFADFVTAILFESSVLIM